jgi:hypothetical protein
MSLHAVDDISDAIAATQAFLFPVNRSRWLRLTLVAFFLAGGLGMNMPVNLGGSAVPGSGSFEAVDGFTVQGDLPGQIPEAVILLAAAIVALVALVALLFGFVGAVLEFVFIESLREEAVHVRRYFKRHWRAGFRLFVFRTLVLVAGLAIVAAVGYGLWVSVLGGTGPAAWTGGEVLATAAVLLPVVLVVFSLTSLVNGFTTAFVVPIMLLESRGVLSAWRRFWPTLSGNLTEYGAYVLLGVAFTIAFAVASASAVGLGAVLLAIPFVLLGVIGFLVAGGSLSLAVGAWFAVLVVLYLLGVFALIALVQVPIQTFLRYYTLLLLGDTEEALDLIPDARAAVRDDTAAG